MRRGEVRRVPVNRDGPFPLFAYHVVCPCGFNGWVLHEENPIVEGEGRGDITVSRPWRCWFCRAELSLTHGDLVARADAETRNATYHGCPDGEDD